MPPGLCMASPSALKVVRSMLWSMPKALCSWVLVSPVPQVRGHSLAWLHQRSSRAACTALQQTPFQLLLTQQASMGQVRQVWDANLFL